MYFFAAMAGLSLLGSVRALIAAAALVAVHHLALNFLASALIYPGGADLGRTLMHAVVLTLETGALVYIVHARNAQQAATAAAAEQADAAAQAARQAAAEVEETRDAAARERRETMSLLRQSFGSVVEAAADGRLDARIAQRFEDPDLNALADGVDGLLESVDNAIQETSTVLRKYADGDTTQHMNAGHKGVFGELRDSVEELGSQLAERERLAAEKAAEERAAENRAIEAERFGAAVNAAVEAAQQGDFSTRMAAEWSSETHEMLAARLNALLGSVDHGLSAVSDVIQRLAGGDVSARMTGAHEGAFERLQNDTNATAERLDRLARAIRSAAGEVHTGLGSIKASTEDISRRAAAQAAAIDETNTAMENFAASMRTNFEKSKQAGDAASEAAEIASSARAVARDAVAAIRQIETSTRAIQEITELVDTIAFQTNLLALNAGVEAARAGEAGKGFAVVAQEVGVLAQRASEASKDIHKLIQQSGREVAEGVSHVEKTDVALGEIEGSIGTVAASVADIATESDNQTSEVERLSSAVIGLDKETQRSAALASQSVDSCAALLTQADQMTAIVGFFKSDDAGEPGAGLAA